MDKHKTTAWRGTNTHFGAPTVALHWVSLVLIVAVYASMELRGFFPRGSGTREAMKTAHFSLGLLVFALAWVRLALRFTGPTPDITPKPSPWSRWAAIAVHIMLYALLLALPVLGWLAMNASGKTVTFFGLELPSLLAHDKALAHQLEDLHKTIAELGYYLIGLHAAAALLHHYVWHDNTLLRMLPVRRN